MVTVDEYFLMSVTWPTIFMRALAFIGCIQLTGYCTSALRLQTILPRRGEERGVLAIDPYSTVQHGYCNEWCMHVCNVCWYLVCYNSSSRFLGKCP